jgi:hypothetical protein
MIWHMLGRALIGMGTGACTAVAVWTALLLIKEGPARTWERVKEMGPVARVGRLSSPWLLKTGALASGVLGAIGAPYLGPIVGGYVWRSLVRIGGSVPGIDLRDVGAAVVGLAAGLVGYLLRVS